MRRRTGLLLTAAALVFAGITTLVGAASGAPIDFLVLDLVTGLAFVVAGFVAVWLRPGSPTGPALLGSAALWWVGSYSPTLQPVVMYLGFAFERWYDLVLAALLLVLSSPAQRLEPRRLVGLLGVAFAIRALGRLTLVDPARDTGCDACPPNPFAFPPVPGAFEVVETASNVAIAVLVLTVGVIVVTRLARAGPVLRRARWLMLVAGVLAMGAAAFDAFEYAWTTSTSSPLLNLPDELGQAFAWGLFGARTLVALAFLLATLRLRRGPGPIGPLAARLADAPDRGGVGDALRSALGDPSLRLLRPTPTGGWTDEDGATVVPGTDGGTARVVGDADRPLAMITHDAALADQPELVDAVVRVLRLALENERLDGALRERLQAVSDSRERIVTAAEDERRRIERDLHDGAQQRLIGVTLALQQARATAEAATVPAELRSQLDAAAEQTSAAIRELRELARGIHPAILEDEGLAAAIAALARRAGIAVDVKTSLSGRFPRLIESTAYFTVAEALTNVQRHAGARRATVRLSDTASAIEVEVSDSGGGGADSGRGTGLRGLQDRVQAVGGRS